MRFNQVRFEAARRVLQLCAPIHNSGMFSEEFQVFETLSSTNQVAWDLVGRGALAGTAILALEQTAGRGQWGREWQSSPGGLYLSVILTPDLAVEASAQLTLCTVLGIAIALRTIPGQLSGVTAALPVQIKWLNDLVLLKRKVGGILTETRIQQGRIHTAVVGIGLNWTNSVPESGINLRSVLEAQSLPLIESLEMLAAITLQGVLLGYQRWQQEGISSLLPDYFTLLVHRDRPIQIYGRWGTIVGITPLGELRVHLSSPQQASLSESEVLIKPGTISLGYDF